MKLQRLQTIIGLKNMNDLGTPVDTFSDLNWDLEELEDGRVRIASKNGKRAVTVGVCNVALTEEQPNAKPTSKGKARG